MAAQHAAILDAIRREPGVQAAGATNFLPFEVGWREPFLIVGDPPPPRREDAPQAQLHSVSDGYFAAMGARIVARPRLHRVRRRRTPRAWRSSTRRSRAATWPIASRWGPR